MSKLGLGLPNPILEKGLPNPQYQAPLFVLYEKYYFGEKNSSGPLDQKKILGVVDFFRNILLIELLVFKKNIEKHVY